MLPVSTLFALIVIICTQRTSAQMVPTTPGPNERYTAGMHCTIAWDPDTSGSWTNVTIDLMSGSNNNMSPVTNVVSALDGTDPSLTPYSWTCPEVDPYSGIYFYQFTNGDEISTRTWTTRFAITSPLNETESPENPSQPDGENIPWGTGHLVNIKSTASLSTPQNVTGQTSATASGKKKPHGPKADENVQSNSAEGGDEYGSSTGKPTPTTRPANSAATKSSADHATAVAQTHSSSATTASGEDEGEESDETFSSSNKGGPSSSYPSDGEEAQSQSSFSDSLPGFPEYKDSGEADAADSAKAMGCHCGIGTDRENGAKSTTQMEFFDVISSVAPSVIITLVALSL